MHGEDHFGFRRKKEKRNATKMPNIISEFGY